MSYLHHYHITPEKLNTFPHKNLKANFRLVDKNLIHTEDEFRKLPPLIKAYLRVGAWVGRGAIVDNKFNTTDVLIILDSKKILKNTPNSLLIKFINALLTYFIIYKIFCYRTMDNINWIIPIF